MLWVVCGISSKTNVWVTAIAILLSLLIKLWVQVEGRRRTLAYAGVFLAAVPVLTAANPLTQYVVNYRQYGSPVLLNIERKPSRGPFLDRRFSIKDGFFTFKYVELLKHPRLDRDWWDNPTNHPSFWTLLYGRANSVHFDNGPRSWSTTGSESFTLAGGFSFSR